MTEKGTKNDSSMASRNICSTFFLRMNIQTFLWGNKNRCQWKIKRFNFWLLIYSLWYFEKYKHSLITLLYSLQASVIKIYLLFTWLLEEKWFVYVFVSVLFYHMDDIARGRRLQKYFSQDSNLNHRELFLTFEK